MRVRLGPSKNARGVVALAGNRYAMVVGVSHYEHVPELKYGDKDARDVADALRTVGFDEDKLMLLHDEGEPADRPTRGTMLHRLGLLSGYDLDADDLVLFYFSGHGMVEASVDYLFPIDASSYALRDAALSVETVFDYLRRTGSRRVIALIDACRDSLATGKGVHSIGANAKSVIDAGDDGLAAIFSCQSNERSFEIDEVDGIQQSSFTHCLLQAIRSREISTLGEAAGYLTREVKILNGQKRLRPQLPYLYPDPNSLVDVPLFVIPGGTPSVAGEYMATLTLLYGDDRLSYLTYYDVMDFLEKDQQDPGRIRLVRDVCSGVTTPETFEQIWKRLRGLAKRPTPTAVGLPGSSREGGVLERG